MEKNILDPTKKKVKIAGLSRIPLWWDRHVGKSHAKRGVIRRGDGGAWGSPWIARKERCYHSYMDRQYELAAEAIAPWQLEAESAITELAMFSKSPIDTSNAEQAMRQSASRQGRRSQLTTALSEIKADLESLDSLLRHREERACDDLMTHVYAYWEGALKIAGEEMPASPGFAPAMCRSKETYIRRKEDLQERIKAALDREEV